MFEDLIVCFLKITNDDKHKLIENSINVLNEIDHRIPMYWPCLTAFCQAISSSVTDSTLSNPLGQVCRYAIKILFYISLLNSGLYKCLQNVDIYLVL